MSSFDFWINVIILCNNKYLFASTSISISNKTLNVFQNVIQSFFIVFFRSEYQFSTFSFEFWRKRIFYERCFCIYLCFLRSLFELCNQFNTQTRYFSKILRGFFFFFLISERFNVWFIISFFFECFDEIDSIEIII
jgi:hypothetical protein